MKLKKKYGLIYSVLLVYALCTVTYTSYVYVTTKKDLLSRIDNQLYLAAKGANSFLGSELYATLSTDKDLPDAEKQRLDYLLTDYANAMGVAYVYTLKRFDTDVRFVVSSLTPKEQKNQSYEPAYFEKYDDMDPSINTAFLTGEVQFAEYRDKWGTFRSIFYPFLSGSDRSHVVGVDIKIDVVRALQKRSVIYSLLACLFFLFVTLPLILIVLRSIAREYRHRVSMFTKDPLTGLPNKNQLLNDLNNSLDVYLAIISISRLGEVTAVHGLSMGDQILKQFAIRLSGFNHFSIKSFKCYYIHGNDFAMVVDHPIPPDQEESVANKLVDLLTVKDYEISESEIVHLSCSIGGVQGDDSARYSPEDLFSMAHMALVETKKKKQNIFFYRANDEYLPSFYKHNLLRVDQLKKALNENRIKGYYHPIFCAKSKNKIVRYECLARLIDEQGNVLLGPDEFIPCAHRSKLYTRITEVILNDAIDFAKKTKNDVSVNLSVSDIVNERAATKIFRRVKRSGVAHHIMFELLEDEYIADYRPIIRFILKLKRAGIRFGIDDVGKNYSNFDRLVSLPVDFIKIDGSVIRYVDTNEYARDVVSDIVAIAHRNNISVVAEYCSSVSTTETAIELGADYLQGFYLAKPESQESIILALSNTFRSSLMDEEIMSKSA